MNRLAFLIPVLVAMAAPASAHPKLLSSNPANAATVAAPKAIALNFSENLFEKLSGATLSRTDVADAHAAHHGAPQAAIGISADGRTMTVTPASPLVAGSYKLDWFGVSGDTHRVTGAITFTVR